MFSIKSVREKIVEMQHGRISPDDFEDWFLSESWGRYDVNGSADSALISAVHEVLARYHADEIDDVRLGAELAASLRIQGSSGTTCDTILAPQNDRNRMRSPIAAGIVLFVATVGTVAPPDPGRPEGVQQETVARRDVSAASSISSLPQSGPVAA